jgi:rhodanese-related sulfurtransferase
MLMRRKYSRALLRIDTLMADMTDQVQKTTEIPVEEELSPEAIHSLLERNLGTSGCVLIDVRKPQEYAAGHIEGARNIDFHSPEFREIISSLDRDHLYILYCKRGIQAVSVQRIMKEQGFRKVCCLQGGIEGWKGAGLPVTK